MHARPLRIVSNIADLADALPPDLRVEHEYLGRDPGRRAALRLFARSFRADVILLDGNEPYLAPLLLLRWLWPFTRARLVSLDIMFVKPVTRPQRLRAWLWRLLLKRVDHFIHYFKDLAGYERYFGIGPDRSTFVPFKVNAWESLPPADQLASDGENVFTGGRSLRDLDTFLAAMAEVPYPGVLLYHDAALVRANGTPLDLGRLPPNVRAIEDDGSTGSWLDHMRRARLVVMTTLPDGIRAIGVSSYLSAMALRKCVIITDGPATRGILTDEALLVPPSDPAALADAIRRAWTDDALRARTAAAGRAYAEQVAGTARLYADVIRVCERVVADQPGKK
jgi:glycosyltransferase involved in cell wall biosynthesis